MHIVQVRGYTIFLTVPFQVRSITAKINPLKSGSLFYERAKLTGALHKHRIIGRIILFFVFQVSILVRPHKGGKPVLLNVPRKIALKVKNGTTLSFSASSDQVCKTLRIDYCLFLSKQNWFLPVSWVDLV